MTTSQSKSAPTIAVVGATGQQGRATAEAVLAMITFAGPHGTDGEVKHGQAIGDAAQAAGVPLQMVATRDIGQVAATALLDPDRIPGGAVEIAGDDLTGEQIATAFGEAEGRKARYEALLLDALFGDDDQQVMFGWFARPPAYQADFELTRDLDPAVWDFRTWLANR